MSPDPAEALRQQLSDWVQPILSQLDNAEAQSDWVQVERLCKQSLQRDAENWSLWQRLAQSHEQRSQWAEAETLWRHMTQRFASRPEPYLALAALQRRRGDADAARAVLEQAERRLQDPSSLREALGVIDDPWAVGETIPHLGPGAGAADLARALQLGQQHLDAGRLVEAEAVLEQILELKPMAGALQLTLARLRQRRGDSDALIAQLEALLQDPRSADLKEHEALALLLGEALIAQQQWQRADSSLGAIGRESTALLMLRAQAAIGRGDDGTALPLLQRSLQLEPAQALAERLLGEVWQRQGDWDAAIAALTRAAALEPDHAATLERLQQAREQRLWWLGENALQRADWEAAEQAYRQMLAIAADHSEALARLDLLASLQPANLVEAETAFELTQSSPEAQLQAFERSLDRHEAQLKMLGVLG